MKVTCRLEAPENDSLIYWGLTMNPCADTVMSIHYPILGCTNQIQVTPTEGGMVYPVFEGSLMKNVYQAGFQQTRRYPGYLTSQLLYYFDAPANGGVAATRQATSEADAGTDPGGGAGAPADRGDPARGPATADCRGQVPSESGAKPGPGGPTAAEVDEVDAMSRKLSRNPAACRTISVPPWCT